MHTADPVAMNRKSCLYTILEIVFWRDFLPIPTGSAVSCLPLPQFPRLLCPTLYSSIFFGYSKNQTDEATVRTERIPVVDS